MISNIKTFGLTGANAYIVTVECFLSAGLPAFEVVGLPDTAVKEARDRVRATAKHLNIDFPKGHITVNLAPAGTKKEGAIYDLPILFSVLEAEGAIKKISDDTAFIGELSLSGELRPAFGVLSMAIAAKAAGIEKLFVPYENAKEAALAGDELKVYGAKNAHEIIMHLEGFSEIPLEKCREPEKRRANLPDFSDVKGQRAVKRALEIAAVGGHNVLMIGPPGSGKSMLSERIPSILPDMTREESLETTELHSIVGLVSREHPLVTERPFRSPHHSTSAVGLSGGGVSLTPGEISLAHNGVLFLDELPEFRRDALEALRQPLETEKITISRVSGTTSYPASFMLVCAMNPCKCGWHGHEGKHTCTCSEQSINRYMGKISGPLLDRIDIHINVQSVTYDDMSGKGEEESSESIKRRVDKARARAYKRGVTCNARLRPKQLHEVCVLDDMSKQLLKQAFDSLGLTGRSYDKILRLALTIADMAESDTIKPEHIAEAIQYRSLDRVKK